ncbi:hypothetical protein BP00DRAFT_421048 [Aspergillus indologenus CBS 114.80]|uniref:Ig-like domain-containing protein n=1 Tax=Aspergillus indologenus CBS 114.80 TaxID=1450541 RepID=A0A2V5IJ04_9EURO|nr:hypothetical protein BP00DRAFT_421048 [Aspergillus indologenus CBS 114.80]
MCAHTFGDFPPSILLLPLALFLHSPSLPDIFTTSSRHLFNINRNSARQTSSGLCLNLDRPSLRFLSGTSYVRTRTIASSDSVDRTDCTQMTRANQTVLLNWVRGEQRTCPRAYAITPSQPNRILHQCGR